MQSVYLSGQIMGQDSAVPLKQGFARALLQRRLSATIGRYGDAEPGYLTGMAGGGSATSMELYNTPGSAWVPQTTRAAQSGGLGSDPQRSTV